MLQLREELGEYKEGNVPVTPVGGVRGDGRDVRVTRLLHHIVHPTKGEK